MPVHGGVTGGEITAGVPVDIMATCAEKKNTAGISADVGIGRRPQAGWSNQNHTYNPKDRRRAGPGKCNMCRITAVCQPTRTIGVA